MAKKTIKIDTGIGGWGYNKQLLRIDLDGTEQDGAVLEISSLGGSAFDAIDMYNQIAQHGNVEVVFTGPSASAATLLAMSAKKVSIIENAFILVHKVSAYVDNYGTFNEEELDKLIQDLQTIRTENQKFDLAFARIYSKKSGNSINDTLELMKRDTWISAQEAKELGLVDEILEPSEKYNFYTERFAACVKSCDLPEIPQSQIANHESQITNMKQFEKLNALLEVEELQASDEGCYLNDEQLNAIEQALTEATQLAEIYSATKAENATATSERNAACERLDEAKQTISGLEIKVYELNASIVQLEQEKAAAISVIDRAGNLLNALDESVSQAEGFANKVEAIRKLLSGIPGEKTPGALDRDDSGRKAGTVDWETINKLPHNREYDRNNKH